MSEEKRVFCDYTVEQSVFVGNKEVRECHFSACSLAL